MSEHTYGWMTDEHQRCWAFVCEVMGGAHRVKHKPRPCGRGISVSFSNKSFATFDSSLLTLLVVRAHDRCVRVDISHGFPNGIVIDFHQRKRDGAFCTRHPTIEAHMTTLRGRP